MPQERIKFGSILTASRTADADAIQRKRLAEAKEGEEEAKKKNMLGTAKHSETQHGQWPSELRLHSTALPRAPGWFQATLSTPFVCGAVSCERSRF